MGIRAVVFDLDGTLVHTEPAAVDALLTTYNQRWKLPLTLEDAALITGRTWEAAQSLLEPKYPLPVPRAEALQILLEAYRTRLRTQIPAVPGGADAVRALKSAYPLALVSGSHRSEIGLALDSLRITELFEFYLGAEDTPRGKPAPDGYQMAMRKLGVQPRETLIFEDSTAGITAGRAAGAWVVAITSTNTFHLDQSQAHDHIADFGGITPEWIHSRPWIARE